MAYVCQLKGNIVKQTYRWLESDINRFSAHKLWFLNWRDNRPKTYTTKCRHDSNKSSDVSSLLTCSSNPPLKSDKIISGHFQETKVSVHCLSIMPDWCVELTSHAYVLMLLEPGLRGSASICVIVIYFPNGCVLFVMFLTKGHPLRNSINAFWQTHFKL